MQQGVHRLLIVPSLGQQKNCLVIWFLIIHSLNNTTKDGSATQITTKCLEYTFIVAHPFYHLKLLVMCNKDNFKWNWHILYNITVYGSWMSLFVRMSILNAIKKHKSPQFVFIESKWYKWIPTRCAIAFIIVELSLICPK